MGPVLRRGHAALALVDVGVGFAERAAVNKTVPEKVATTRTEDGHEQNTKTSTTI